MTDLGLLSFTEGYFEKIWGGQKLASLFGMPIPAGKRIGEAWLVSDHEVFQSTVADGPYQGATLRHLLEADKQAVLGSRANLTVHGRFPLLLKIIDANEVLSVQVHPDDECAAALHEPDVGKTEMWHVLDAAPRSELICGLKPDVTRDRFVASVERGSVEDLMVSFQVNEGASVFVPAGTVHAINGGVVLAEIQQNSNLTYRIYDWGRVQQNGSPRELHIEKAEKAIHFGSAYNGPAQALRYRAGNATCSILGACRYFAAELILCDGSYHRATRNETFHIVLAKSDGLDVLAGPFRKGLKRGRALVVPGALDGFTVQGKGAFLDYYVPDLERDVVAPLLAEGHSRTAIVRLGGDPLMSDLRECASVPE
jgi:mannose-6-phosphate isomerase